jgi:predicted enzyme related to lactoylglutathione lyase
MAGVERDLDSYPHDSLPPWLLERKHFRHFGIHPRRPDAPAKSSGSVAVVFRVEDYDAYLANAAKNKIVPKSTESDADGRFAHFVDPDGNEMTIWGAAKPPAAR